MKQFHIDPTDSNFVFVNGRRLARVRGAETPPAGGGQGAVADPPVQPPGQGEPAGQQDAQPNDDFWGMFPQVPEEHRPILEPVLRQQVLPHVTRLEQQIAPLKPVFDRGYTPEQITGLVNFSDNFDANPKGTWLAIAADLQEKGVLPDDLDLDALKIIADGGDPDEDLGPTPQGQQPQGDEAEVPPWAQEVIDWKRSEEQRRQQEDAQRQQDAQDRLLARQMEKARTTLKEAGFNEELVTDKRLIGALLANNGDPTAAVADLTELRTGLLKGVVNERENNGGKELELPEGAPPTTPKRTPRDPFEAARGGAMQHLKSANRSAAQGG
jgi:hypothetical protein